MHIDPIDIDPADTLPSCYFGGGPSYRGPKLEVEAEATGQSTDQNQGGKSVRGVIQ
jgi:hypothetical protein